MNTEILSYLAGCMDCDGCFTIHKDKYAMKIRGDAKNIVYQEKIALKQVYPDIPQLFKNTFGGSYWIAKSYTKNGRPLYCWGASCRIAAHICEILLPYLKLKKEQAKVILELRSTHSKGYVQQAYWYKQANPTWQTDKLITVSEAAKILGMRKDSVLQAIRNNTLLGIPGEPGREIPRISKGLVIQLKAIRHPITGHTSRPQELINWRERLYWDMRRLNRVGLI